MNIFYNPVKGIEHPVLELIKREGKRRGFILSLNLKKREER